jgi:hypothetical protein
MSKLDDLAAKKTKADKEFIDEWYKSNNINPKTDTKDYSVAINRDFKTLKSGESYNSNNASSGNANFFQKAGGSLLGIARDVVKTGEATTIQGMDADLIKVDDIANKILDAQNNIKGIGDLFGSVWKSALGGVTTYLEQQSGLLTDINRKGSLNGQLSKDYRQELTLTNIELLKYGISFSQISQAATDILNNSGRFLTFNQQSFETFGKTAEAYMGGLENFVKLVPDFEKVGIGAIDAAKSLGDAGQKALSLGLNTQKVTATIGENIGKLNEYGFKNGIQGLSEMTRKSIEFRTSLESAYSIAEKVMDPQGALDFSAKLQVIGGAIGDFGDPLKLMYMATNNVEGLQDAFIKAAGSLSTYNAQQGKFEINSLNMRRMRDMAQATGIQIGELSKTAIAFQERMSAKQQLSLIPGITGDVKEFITNLAHMEGGKMTIDLQGTQFRDQFDRMLTNGKVTLEELAKRPELIKLMKDNQDKLSKMSQEDVIKGQASNVRQIERYVQYLVAEARMQGGKSAIKLGQVFGIDADLSKSITDELKNLGDNYVKKYGVQLQQALGTHTAEGKALQNAINAQQKSNTAKDAEKNMKSDKQTTDQNTNTNNGTQQIEHNVNIKVPALLDDIGRGIAKDSSFITNLTERNARLYTNNAIKTN